MKDEYEQIKNEVIDFNKKIILHCENYENLNEYYMGYQILYSPLIEKPDIMLIGINPGCGHIKVPDYPRNSATLVKI